MTAKIINISAAIATLWRGFFWGFLLLLLLYLQKASQEKREIDGTKPCIRASSLRANADTFQGWQNIVLKLSSVGSDRNTIFQIWYEICNACHWIKASIGYTAAPKYLSYCCSSIAGTHSETAKTKPNQSSDWLFYFQFALHFSLQGSHIVWFGFHPSSVPNREMYQTISMHQYISF